LQIITQQNRLSPHLNSSLSADAIDSVLVSECEAVTTQLAYVPTLRDAIQQRDELQRELTALSTAQTNFKEIARVGTTHKAAVAAVLQQPLIEEDYLTLADRHAALVQKLTTTCEELAEAEDYDAVILLGDKLNELKALDVATLPSSHCCHAAVLSAVFAHASRSYDVTSGVVAACDALVTQFATAPRTREAILRRNELQNTLTALRAAKSDFAAVGQVGKALKAANAELAQLPLSEEDYLTLADRHAALLQNLTTTCAELADAGEYDALDTLAAKLEELQALDVSALPQSWVQPPAPPAHVEREDDDPVYVPPATDETTVA
jgi:Skp family chaperone for outer membrane proteins